MHRQVKKNQKLRMIIIIFQRFSEMSPFMEGVWYAVGGALFGWLAFRMVKRSFI